MTVVKILVDALRQRQDADELLKECEEAIEESLENVETYCKTRNLDSAKIALQTAIAYEKVRQALNRRKGTY